MRILVTADPYIPVPPTHYGGIERVIDMLVRELSRRGHAVTLVAHPGSRTAARLIPYGRPPHVGIVRRAGELLDVGSALWRERAAVDLVHSFGRLAALLPILPLRALPKIQSYQRDEVPWHSVARAVRLAGASLAFTGCSSHMYRGRASSRSGDWTTVFNGVDVTRYTPTARVAADAPLVFLGRLDPIKGAHHAITIAREAGRRLVIAGPRSTTGGESAYFETRIAPFVDGTRITYAGPVDDVAKNDLLGAAAALLMPIEWDEPFGIVMAESFACGTPAIAFPRGSVSEVVRDGLNGFICATPAEAARAVARLDALDRRAIRADCEARFAAPVIADAYERLYERLLGRVGSRAGA